MVSFRKDECGEGKRGKQDAGKCERVLFNAAADQRYLRNAGKCDGGCVCKRNEHAAEQKKAPGYANAPFDKTYGNPRNRKRKNTIRITLACTNVTQRSGTKKMGSSEISSSMLHCATKSSFDVPVPIEYA